MTPSAPTNARGLALAALLECHKKEAFVQEVLDRHFQQSKLSAADRRLAMQMAYGVLRRRGTLDALLIPLVTRERHKTQPWLWEALRLGAFQLALMSNIPVHAAIYETVELAAVFGQPKAKGFLNGVLRALSRLLTAEAVHGPAEDSLPVGEGEYRRLAKPVFPSPQERPADYLGAAFSLPEWLAERWLARWGWEECVRLGFWFAGPAPLYLRVNRLRCDRETLLGRLVEAEIHAEPGEHPQAIRICDHGSVRDLPGFEEGWFVVQDDSAMQVATALAPAPGWTVLDLCAGPGSKTTHLAELMENRGKIVACDIDEKRLRPLSETCVRLGIDIVGGVILKEGTEPPPGPFDAALVDVPCSNTGVLGRRPELRWRLKPGDLGRLVELQTRLLTQAVERVKPGGVVVYSTCSVEPEESRGVVDAVRAKVPDLTVEAEKENLPGRPADGGYWAKLRKPR